MSGAPEEDNLMTSQWTPEAIRALGSTTDLPTLGSIFGLSTWRSRQMAHTGEWEQAGIRIIKIGNRYRVAVLSILDVLSNGGTPGTDTGADPENTEALPAQDPGHADGIAVGRPAQR